MKTLLPLLAVCMMVAAVSCSNGKGKNYSENRTRMEAQAQQMLQQARKKLAAGSPAEAKALIEKMRTDCYLAIDARTQGILLMDSVDLRLSQIALRRTDSLMRSTDCDSIGQDDFNEACRKVQFYERKLQFDKKQ